MAEENKVEYERVDEEGDRYKRILVKFNPRFLRGSDFEIEFIPLERAFAIGEMFVKEIDSVSTINLYQWAIRQECLTRGGGADERGTILSRKDDLKRADMLAEAWRQGRAQLEPRQVISRVKRVFEGIKDEFTEPTSYIYNHFLLSGQLGSLPFYNEDFNIEKLRVGIEEGDCRGVTAEGEKIWRPFVEHLFDTHKTEYIQANICWFLETLRSVSKMIVEEHDKKQ